MPHAPRHGVAACSYAGIDVSAGALAVAGRQLLREVPGLRREQLWMEAATYQEGLHAVRARSVGGDAGGLEGRVGNTVLLVECSGICGVGRARPKQP